MVIDGFGDFIGFVGGVVELDENWMYGGFFFVGEISVWVWCGFSFCV